MRAYRRLFRADFWADTEAVKAVEREGRKAPPALVSKAAVALIRLAEWDPRLLCTLGFGVVLQKQQAKDARFFRLLGAAIARVRRKMFFLPTDAAFKELWWGWGVDGSGGYYDELKTLSGRKRVLQCFVDRGLVAGEYTDQQNFERLLRRHGFL
jgi:hypothetical protein